MGKVNSKTINEIKRFKDRVEGRYGIERMIFFGSSAVGAARPDSDIDLIIVVKKPIRKLVSKLLLEWHVSQGIKQPIDFIDYTEQEFIKASKGVTLVSQALKEGIEII